MSECVAWLIAHVAEAFARSTSKRLDLIILIPLLVLGRAMVSSNNPEEIGVILTQEVLRISQALELDLDGVSFKTVGHRIAVVTKVSLRQTIKKLALPSLDNVVSPAKKVVVLNILWEQG